MKQLFASLFLVFLFSAPLCVSALPTMTTCHCSSSYLSLSAGWVTTNFTYATNNGSCTPNGSNTYNFGYADVYVDGDYVGTSYFTTGGANINNYLMCGNLA